MVLLPPFMSRGRRAPALAWAMVAKVVRLGPRSARRSDCIEEKSSLVGLQSSEETSSISGGVHGAIGSGAVGGSSRRSGSTGSRAAALSVDGSEGEGRDGSRGESELHLEVEVDGLFREQVR